MQCISLCSLNFMQCYIEHWKFTKLHLTFCNLFSNAISLILKIASFIVMKLSVMAWHKLIYRHSFLPPLYKFFWFILTLSICPIIVKQFLDIKQISPNDNFNMVNLLSFAISFITISTALANYSFFLSIIFMSYMVVPKGILIEMNSFFLINKNFFSNCTNFFQRIWLFRYIWWYLDRWILYKSYDERPHEWIYRNPFEYLFYIFFLSINEYHFCYE